MNSTLVSIAVCTRNRAALLGTTMKTIMAQSHRPVEVLVVDDGSTDETGEVVASFGGKVRYHRQEQQGIAAARTAACRLADGELIAFQDDDDLMPPHRIDDLLGALRAYPRAVFAVGDWALIDPAGRETGSISQYQVRSSDGKPVLIEDGYRAVLWPLLSPVPHTTLFRRADAERIGWFDSGRFFHACSDTDFYARLGKLGPVVYMPKVVSLYRMGHAQIWGNRLLSEYSRFLLFEKHLAETGDVLLKERLSERLFGVLMELRDLERDGGPLPEAIPEDYLTRGVALLPPSRRLAFHMHGIARFGICRKMKNLMTHAGRNS